MTTNSPSFAKLGEGIASLFGFGGETPVARAGEGIGLSNIFTRSLLLSLIFFVFVVARAPGKVCPTWLFIGWTFVDLLARSLAKNLVFDNLFLPAWSTFGRTTLLGGPGNSPQRWLSIVEISFIIVMSDMWGSRWSFTSLHHMWYPGDDWETVAAPRGSRRRAGLTRGRLRTFGLNFFHFVVIDDGDGDCERASWSY